MIDRTKESAISQIAEIYQQLYLDPGKPESADEYKKIVLFGQGASKRDLSHFMMNEKDSCELAETPAGPVRILTLYERKDFETALCILAKKCVPYDVPATQGASILDGLVNWQKIRQHKDAWFKAELEKGVSLPDWSAEFKRFTSDRANFKDVLIILSAGPYSNIPASDMGLGEEEWRRLSMIIRKYHECTHFICRRLYPDRIDAIRDEIIADAVGIIAAFGKFDPETEERFFGIKFGIKGAAYAGGRLENYVDKEKEDMDLLAAKIHDVLMNISDIYEENKDADPFGFAMILENESKV